MTQHGKVASAHSATDAGKAKPGGTAFCASGGATGLHGAVLAAVAEQLKRVGPDAFKANRVVSQFKGRVSTKTLLRWIGEATAPTSEPAANGALTGIHVAAIDVNAPSQADDDASLSARMVSRRGFDDGGTFTRLKQDLLREANEGVEACCDADGSPRDMRLYLAALEHKRRLFETLVRHGGSAYNIEAMKGMNRMIIDTISEESPECAARILARLSAMLA